MESISRRNMIGGAAVAAAAAAVAAVPAFADEAAARATSSTLVRSLTTASPREPTFVPPPSLRAPSSSPSW